MRTSAVIAVTAVSLSAISVSYAKGVVPDSTNGLAPLPAAVSGQPGGQPTASANSQPSQQPDSSSSAQPKPRASTSSGKPSSGPKPAPKPSKSSGSSSAPKPSTAPKPTTAPKPAPQPVIKTVNSDMMSYKYGQLQISVTFKDSTITAITMLYGENNNGRGAAYPVLIAAAIQAQGTNFGNYTGATYTTQVFKDALLNAIAKR